MFPEYKELMLELRDKNPDFKNKFDAHEDLDKEIQQLEKSNASDYTSEVKELKLKKLHLKEEIQQILQSHQ